MDPLKTAFIDALPAQREDDVPAALKPLGLVRWVAAAPGTGFAQFASAAQIKAALEVLPLAGLHITVSTETATWVARAAARATVQNVTRMSPKFLANKIRNSLAKVQQGRTTKPDTAAHALQSIAPDGTLDSDDPRLWDEIRRFRESSRRPKPAPSTRPAKRARSSPDPTKLDPSEALPSATKEPDPTRASQPSPPRPHSPQSSPARLLPSPPPQQQPSRPPATPQRDQLPSKEASLSESATSPSELPAVQDSGASKYHLEKHEPQPPQKHVPVEAQKHVSPEARKHVSPEPEPRKSLSPEPQKHPSPEPQKSLSPGPQKHPSPEPQKHLSPPQRHLSPEPSPKNDQSSEPLVSLFPQDAQSLKPPAAQSLPLPVTAPKDTDLETRLPSLIEEFFGEPDEDVIRVVKGHIVEARSDEQLAAEFRDVLEDDFARFAEKVKTLSK